MWYKVDFRRLALENTPTFLRKVVLVGFIEVIKSPLIAVYDDWVAMRTSNLYKIAHTGQVCYLRKSLNDAFDSSLRRIYIANTNQFDREYIYTRAEQQPKFLGTMYLHSRTDFADTGVDFIVYVPAAIVDAKIFELQAHIEFYKEGVKRYKIVKI